MRTEDLKSGDILESVNHRMGLIIKTELGMLIQWDDYWGYLGTGRLERDDGIKAVRRINNKHNIIRQNLHNAPIIWERKKEIPEYTMEELQKKLGEEFKIKK